jgi:superfamily II DNA or RNA helicase
MIEKVQILLGSKYSRVVDELPPYIDLQIRERMCYYRMGWEHTKAHKESGWDGLVHMYRQGRTFMTGLISVVREVLTQNDMDFEIIDRRVRPETNFPELKFSVPDGVLFEERPYQEFTIKRCMAFTRGIIQVGTGGGKTIIVTGLIGALQVRPFVYFVMTKDLMIQAINTLSTFLNTEIGMVGDGKCDIKDITVCTIQTAVQSLKVKDGDFDSKNYRFDSEDIWDEDQVFLDTNAEKIRTLVAECRGFYFDEVHHASARTCQEVIFAADKAYYKYGGTATPRRTDGEEMVIQGLFGGKIVEISPTYLTELKYLVPGHIFNTRVDNNCGGETLYGGIYKNAVVENDNFNDVVADVAQFLAQNNILSLILVQQVKHGKILKKKIPGSEFLSGRDTTKKRTRVIEDLRDGNLKILIATTLADEGLDIRRLGAVFMLAGGASVTRIPQRIGRCIRPFPNKMYGMFFYFRHTVKYLFEQGRQAQELFDEEDCWTVQKVKGIEHLKQAVCEFINRQNSLFDGKNGF